MSEQQPEDPITRTMDRWQLEAAVTMVIDQGYRFGTAWAIAGFGRSLLEQEARKPLPFVLLTGI